VQDQTEYLTDDTKTNFAMLVGRLIVLMPFIPNGISKIMNFTIIAGIMGGTVGPQILDGRLFPTQTPLFNFPVPEFFLVMSICFDLIGSALLIVGWRARTVAPILAGYVLLAMLIYHYDVKDGRDVMTILRNLPFVGGLILMSAFGAGAWSVDGWLRKKNKRA